MKSFGNKSARCALVVGSFLGVADAGQIIGFEAPQQNLSKYRCESRTGSRLD
jgi:hypothetical protein